MEEEVSAADALEELLLEIRRDEENWQLDNHLEFVGRKENEQRNRTKDAGTSR